MDDFDRLSLSIGRDGVDAYARLMSTLVQEELALLVGPHIVVCSSRDSTTLAYTGPYPDGLTALIAAERDAGQIEDDDLEFRVSPLLPP
ncbi:hypothetical protein NOCA2290017 [metagenome]|uniref:Uncharacterized protein n=1 Tax=metagenome TaxID=256318 RepID=A0A2P2C0T6_9ZZZZ